MRFDKIENPKLSQTKLGRPYWSRFYAAYSEAFCRSVLLEFPHEGAILDPWSGSGTTVSTANTLGKNAVGVDINPAMIVVSKARLLSERTKLSVPALALNIIKNANLKTEVAEGDLLCNWFTPASARFFRALERSINSLLVSGQPTNDIKTECDTARLSDVAAYMYLILFATVRRFLSHQYTTNPTWIKNISDARRRLRPNWTRISETFVQCCEAELHSFSGVTNPDPLIRGEVVLGCSKRLPVADGLYDLVLSSPPYYTRIDYAVLTLPELSVLGYNTSSFRAIREAMMGTPVISKGQEDRVCKLNSLPSYSRSIAAKIANHSSKASKSYYSKIHNQYVADLEHSLSEIHRALSTNGFAILVLQDSYYKDIHIDLSRMVIELAENHRIHLVHKKDFPVKKALRAVNPHLAPLTRQSPLNESVLCFRKG